MAYLKKDEENTTGGMNVLGEQQQQAPQDGQAQQGIGVSGVAPAAAPQQAGPQPTATKTPKGSGRFTNLQTYLSANKGAGKQMAEQTVGKIKTSAEDIGQAIQQKLGKADEGTGYLGNIAKKTADAGNYLTSGKQMVQAVQSGQQITPEQQQQFQRYMAGQTAEGQQLAAAQPLDLSQQAQRAREIARAASEAGTEAGRFQLLRKTFGEKSPYTRGQSTLDQLLLQRSGVAPELASQAQKEALGLQGTISSAQAEAEQAAKDLEVARTGLTTGLQEAVGGAETALEQQARQRVEQYNTRLQEASQALQNAFQTGTLSRSVYDQLDEASQKLVDRMAQEGMLYQVQPSLPPQLAAQQPQLVREDYQKALLESLGTQPTLQDVENISTRTRFASPELMARYQALEALTGGKARDIFAPDVAASADPLQTISGADLGMVDPTAAGGYEVARQAAINRINDLIVSKNPEAYEDLTRVLGQDMVNEIVQTGRIPKEFEDFMASQTATDLEDETTRWDLDMRKKVEDLQRLRNALYGTRLRLV